MAAAGPGLPYAPQADPGRRPRSATCSSLDDIGKESANGQSGVYFETANNDFSRVKGGVCAHALVGFEQRLRQMVRSPRCARVRAHPAPPPRRNGRPLQKKTRERERREKKERKEKGKKGKGHRKRGRGRGREPQVPGRKFHRRGRGALSSSRPPFKKLSGNYFQPPRALLTLSCASGRTKSFPEEAGLRSGKRAGSLEPGSTPPSPRRPTAARGCRARGGHRLF